MPCLLASLCVLAAPAELTIVAEGKPVEVRYIGGGWDPQPGLLVGHGYDHYLCATRELGTGDFALTLRLTIDHLDRSAASLELGDSHFLFEGSHHEMALGGAAFGDGVKLGSSEGWLTAGQLCELRLTRVGAELSLSIGGKELWQGDGSKIAGRVALRPWRSTMRVASFKVSGDLVDPPEVQPPAPLEAAERVFIQDGKPLGIRTVGAEPTLGEGYLSLQGTERYLWADRALATGDFDLTATLSIHGLANSAASLRIAGGDFGFCGAHGQVWASGGPFGRAHKLGEPAKFIQEGQPFTLLITRRGRVVCVFLDGKLAEETGTINAIDAFGLRPWRSEMRVSDFRARGALVDPPTPRTQPQGYSIPTVDLSGDASRRTIVARGTKDVYQGHPTTVLMPDGKTIFAAWTINHGGHCGPLKRSDDAGRTWSELIPVPDNWIKVNNCPCLHRLVDPQGQARLFVFAGNGPMYQSVSLDQGRTWSPMEPNGLSCVVAPLTILPIHGGQQLLAAYHRPPAAPDKWPACWQAVSDDGGLTWHDEQRLAIQPWGYLCEPALVRSPDGKQLACVMRENERRYNSFVCVSDDEGATWSAPRELPGSLTGDRHCPKYAPDGRLVMTFRDVANESPTRGEFVGWVGTYDDLVNAREGQYRIRLMTSPRKLDLGYPGLELLPDGTLLTTTYIQLAKDELNSVVCVRFKLDETDKLAAHP